MTLWVLIFLKIPGICNQEYTETVAACAELLWKRELLLVEENYECLFYMMQYEVRSIY